MLSKALHDLDLELKKSDRRLDIGFRSRAATENPHAVSSIAIPALELLRPTLGTQHRTEEGANAARAKWPNEPAGRRRGHSWRGSRDGRARG